MWFHPGPGAGAEFWECPRSSPVEGRMDSERNRELWEERTCEMVGGPWWDWVRLSSPSPLRSGGQVTQLHTPM